MQLVVYFADFHEKITPFLAVERKQPAFLGFLRNRQVARAVRVVAPFEIAEIGRREKLVLAARLVLELFLDENVLFVNGISFAQSLCKGREKLRELVVTVDIRGVFLHRILHFQDGGILAAFGVQYAYAVRIFHGIVNVLKDTFTLAAGSESIDRYGHAGTYGYEDQNNVQSHFKIHK